MKILQVTNYFKPLWEAGGVARVSYELSRSLASHNHQVTVYTTNKRKRAVKHKPNEPIIEDNIKIFYFENFLQFIPFKTLPLPFFSIFTIKREVKTFQIIHIHEHRTMLAVIVSYYARKYHIPYIIQSHGSVLPIQKHYLKKLYDFVWGNKILRNASKLIALTDTEAGHYQSMGVPLNKIEIIPNGIDLVNFENLPDYGQLRKKYGIRENCKLILYVGRLHKSKGLDLLIDTFYEINKNKIDAHLILIGPDDGYLNQMIHKIQKFHLEGKILIIGFVSQDEKIKAFIDADVFVTPSYSGFPITFLEASICGCPIVTTNKGDTLNWIDKRTGFVVDYNCNDLKNAILNLLTDDELRKEYSIKAKKTVADCFSKEKMIELNEKLYSDIEGESGGKYIL